MDIKKLREKFLKQAVEKSSQLKERDDLNLVHLERVKEELEKITNILGERLEEWAKIKGLRKRRDEIANSPINKDVEVIGKLYREAKDSLSYVEKRIEEEAKNIMPNTTHLVGSKIAAKLLSHVGSLEKLAKMPASTIQVLGAEKSLFKHLRTKGKVPSPKHGIIYLSKYINTLPKKLRGKMARRLASKLSIALKADLAKDDIRELLKKDVEERYKKLKEESSKLKQEKPKKQRKKKRKR